MIPVMFVTKYICWLSIYTGEPPGNFVNLKYPRTLEKSLNIDDVIDQYFGTSKFIDVLLSRINVVRDVTEECHG